MPAWTSEDNEKLLVAILKTSHPKIDLAAVAAYLGNGRTGYAIQHQIRKLQKVVANVSQSNGNNAGAAGNTKKPAAAKRSRKAVVKQAGSADGGHEQSEGGGSDDGSDESPAKKRKVKPEPELDDEGEDDVEKA